MGGGGQGAGGEPVPYFLKRCLSSMTPSEVFFSVSFSVAMHSFSRGSPVRSPVVFSACANSIAESIVNNAVAKGLKSFK